MQFDNTSKQGRITQPEKIKSILNSFPTIPFSHLKKEYLSKTKYEKKKYKKLAKGSNLLIIKGKDIFKFIVGSFRIKDFLPKDDFYYENINALGAGKEIFWMVDEKLLLKLLELQNVLFKNGYNENGFTIVNGFRHPAYNEKVGGASLSRHLKGQALDLQIGDINNDGIANQKDKIIVLDFLENKIIKDEGGIGKYPGTMSVHFDVRGYRARWDQQ
ncbi:MAG: D-Ala-D-Ala carboxypeptidase family metallohydrolase [Saprospiraceae bacterium]